MQFIIVVEIYIVPRAWNTVTVEHPTFSDQKMTGFFLKAYVAIRLYEKTYFCGHFGGTLYVVYSNFELTNIHENQR
jgi:hypothetical protein